MSRDVNAACIVTAASPVEHDWEFRVCGGVGGRPDGERQAVFCGVLGCSAVEETLAVVDD